MIHTTITLTFYRVLWGSKVDIDIHYHTEELPTKEDIDYAGEVAAPSQSPGADWRLWGWKVKPQQSAGCAD